MDQVADTTPTDIRLRLRQAGFDPIPLRGKNPGMMRGWEWQKLLAASGEQIHMWGKSFPDAHNTGIITRLTPAFDIDILHPAASEAVEEFVREQFEERGYILTRIGLAPKRALLFRTDKPFAKLVANLVAPDGSLQKLEFLGDGQQLAAFGIHPDTQKPYTWHGGEPGNISREDLPYIIEAEARQIVDRSVAILVEQFGFKLNGPAAKPAQANGADHSGGADWLGCIGNVIDHDGLTKFAASLVTAGMQEAAAINFLRAQLEASPASRDDRWQRRFNEIPAMVHSGARLVGKAAEEEQPQLTSPNEGKAFGYAWTWKYHGEVDPTETRKWLVETLLPETGAGLIAGQWGTFKTFVADDLSAAVMTGTEFIRFAVRRQGAVLFFACEGQNEVAIRLTAAFEARGGTGKAPFAWVENCPRLLDPNAAKILVAMVKQAGERLMEEFGLPVALVLIDTAGKAAGYTKTGDENDAATAKQIMRVLSDVSIETQALFVGVAHFGKNVETGTRGSSSYEDDSDVVLALLGEKGQSGAVSNTRLCARKRRTGANGEEFPFKTNEVVMGTDPNGTAVTTLTIEWLPQVDAPPIDRPKADQWSKALRLLRQNLMTIIADCGSDQRPYPDGPVVRAVDLEQVREEFYKSYPATGDAKAKANARRQAFHRAIKDAGSRGLIATRDIGIVTFVWLSTPETPANAHSEDRDA